MFLRFLLEMIVLREAKDPLIDTAGSTLWHGEMATMIFIANVCNALLLTITKF